MKTPRRDTTECGGEGRGRGFGEFLRSLLAGIPWSESAQKLETLRLPPPAGATLRIHNSNGRTCVVGEDRDDIEVRIEKRARAESQEAAARLVEAIELTRSEAQGALELEVEVPKRWNRHGSANLELLVPRGSRVEVVASNGKICLEGLRGGVRARSSNGAVRVIDVVGSIEVHTSNAKVTCGGTCGRLTARSSNGKIEVDEHRGSIDASTSNGSIQATLAELGEEGVLLATSNGRIGLTLPEKVDAELDVRVDNGVIRNGRTLSRGGGESNGRLRGTLGRGGAPIRLRTSNGSIALR